MTEAMDAYRGYPPYYIKYTDKIIQAKLRCTRKDIRLSVKFK